MTIESGIVVVIFLVVSLVLLLHWFLWSPPVTRREQERSWRKSVGMKERSML